MDDHDGDPIGIRIAELRVMRGLNQRQLARRATVSYSLLTKVEAGHAAATPVLVGAIARALKVDIPRITGQPYDGPTSGRVYPHVLSVRRALLTYDLHTEPAAPPRPLPQLRAAVTRVSDLRRRTRFAALAAELPALLDELSYLAHTSDTTEAYALFGEACYAAECLGSGLGVEEVYLLGIERVCWAAQRRGDPLMIGAGRWGRAGPLMRDGAVTQGLALLDHARSEIPDSSPDALSVQGSLHLRSALLAARAGHRADAWSHIAEAETLAQRTGETNNYELLFGPANVAVTGVTVAVELADASTTITKGEAAAAQVQAPSERKGHMLIDMARAYLMDNDRRDALTTLQRARQVAPEQTRAHPMTREVTRVIAANSRTTNDEVRRFAAWLGISATSG